MTTLLRFEVNKTLKIEESIIQNWLTLIEANYHSANSYHNSSHAADVLQATAYFLEKENVCRVAGVVVAVGTMVVGLYQCQPVLHDALVDLQSFVHLKPQQGRHPKPDQGPSKYRVRERVQLTSYLLLTSSL